MAHRTRLVAAVVGLVAVAVVATGLFVVQPWNQQPKCPPAPDHPEWSVARRWDEATLDAIRRALPAPTVHARNLFHTSAAMWDAWATYDPTADGYIFKEKHTASNADAARQEAMSYAAYRILTSRYIKAVGGADSLSEFDDVMDSLCYPIAVTTTDGDLPAAVGNRIAAAVIAYGSADGSNQANGYADPTYTPVNDPLVVAKSGTTMKDPNRWQPLQIEHMVSQNGIPVVNGVQQAVGTQWGHVKSFALPDAGVAHTSAQTGRDERNADSRHRLRGDPGNPRRSDRRRIGVDDVRGHWRPPRPREVAKRGRPPAGTRPGLRRRQPRPQHADLPDQRAADVPYGLGRRRRPAVRERGARGWRFAAGERGDDLQHIPTRVARLAAIPVRGHRHRPARRGSVGPEAVLHHSRLQLARRIPDGDVSAPVHRFGTAFSRRAAIDGQARRSARSLRRAGQRPAAALQHAAGARRHAVRLQPQPAARPHEFRRLAGALPPPAHVAAVARDAGRQAAAGVLRAALRQHRRGESVGVTIAASTVRK